MNLILMRINLCFEVAASLKVDERVHRKIQQNFRLFFYPFLLCLTCLYFQLHDTKTLNAFVRL